MQTKNTFDCEIVRLFYVSNLLFHLARSPYYKCAFCYDSNTCNLNGYIFPTSNKLRGHLLYKKKTYKKYLYTL